MAFARGPLLVLGVVVVIAAAAAEGGGSVCFDWVFSFRDSLTDTGNFLLSVPEDFPDPARHLPYDLLRPPLWPILRRTESARLLR
jgi:hypothetical protein